MAVRITKPDVNLRSIFSELERPIGLKGSELMRAETAQDARDLVSAGRKNLLINGDMRINQRGLQGTGGTTNLTSGVTYGIDRWFWNQSSGSTFRMATTTDVPSGSGFINSLRLTLISVGSLGSSTYHFLRQKIEGFDTEQLCWGTSKAKPVTLSFWVKSSIAASNHCVYVGFQGVGVYSVLYSIDNSDTWEYKTITIPGATSGTWGTGTSGSVEVEFDFGVGSSFSVSTNKVWTYGSNVFGGSGTVNFASGPANSTWNVTGVQLEVGKNATEFEHRSYGEELALCQRYFEVIFNTDGYPNTFLIGKANSTSQALFAFPWKVVKRAAPTAAISGTGLLYYNGVTGTNTYTIGYNAGTIGGRISLSNIPGSPLTVGEALHFDTNSSPGFVMTVDAEL